MMGMTPREAYDKVNNPTMLPDGRYEMDYIKEDDFAQSKLKLEELQRSGYPLEIVKANDVLVPYEMHGIIVRLKRDQMQKEMEITSPALTLLGEILVMMDAVYVSAGSDYIILTKQIYKFV